MKEKASRSFQRYVSILVKWRLFVVKFVVIATGVALITSLIITQKFAATAAILPPSQEQESMIGLLSTRLSSGVSGLGRMAGLLPGSSTVSDLFAAIMESSTIRGALIRKYDLMKEFKCKTITDTYKALEKITNIEVSGEGIVSVSVIYKDKFLAADLANSYIDELDKFNKETAMTVGKRYRIFVENRLKESFDSLVQAEEAMRNFQETHKTVALDTEIETAIQTLAALKGQVIALEVRRGALSSSAQSSNPYLLEINKELRELEKQLNRIEIGKGKTTSEFGAGFSVPFAKLPEVALEYARLLRDVEVQTAIYELLTEQYEQAKIMEVKDTPTVQFLDRAYPAERKTYPKRGAMVVFCAVSSVLVGIFLAYVIEYAQQFLRSNEWQHLYLPLREDLTKFKNTIFRHIKRKG